MKEQTTKYCNKCKQEKPIESFGININKPDGRADYCKSCFCLLNKLSYEKNKDNRMKKIKEWQEKNKQKTLDYKKVWRDNQKTNEN